MLMSDCSFIIQAVNAITTIPSIIQYTVWIVGLNDRNGRSFLDSLKDSTLNCFLRGAAFRDLVVFAAAGFFTFVARDFVVVVLFFVAMRKV